VAIVHVPDVAPPAPSTLPEVTAPAGPGRSRRHRRLALRLGYGLVAALVIGQVGLNGTPSSGAEREDLTAPVDGPAPAPQPPPPTDGPPGDPASWTTAFADEFDGTSIDPARWRVNRYGGADDDGAFNPDIEGAYYSPDNVGVAGGSAWLEIRPEPATIEGRPYTHSSGMLSSQGTFEMQDGDFVEARVWLPTGPGLWPAFWTQPADRWPPEIDILEVFDTGKSGTPYFVYHPLPAGDGVNRDTMQVYGEPGADYRQSWHTFGLLRSGGLLVPYLDGVAYPSAGASGADTLPQYLMLNLAMYAGNQPDPGARMLIDWVRVWRPV
jgi:beta-glucanase (GH16 family)